MITDNLAAILNLMYLVNFLGTVKSEGKDNFISSKQAGKKFYPTQTLQNLPAIVSICNI